MYEGIVLAGGYSSRFNKNKMCVDFKGEPLITHTIKTMLTICEKVYVVTGHYHTEIKKVLSEYKNVEIVYNLSYDLGMFSSVKAGVHHVEHDFFIIPGDYPLINKKTYLSLIKGSKGIRVPSYNKRFGHPLFISLGLKTELLNSDLKSLKEFRNKYDFEIIDVEDANILRDIDTLDDLKEIKGKV